MDLLKIPKEINLETSYDNQENILDTENYKKYLEYLRRYYRKPEEQRNYRRVQDGDDMLEEGAEDILVLVNIKKSKNRVLLEPTRYVDLMSYKIHAFDRIHEILYQLSYIIENRDKITDDERLQFDLLKEEYVNIKKHMDEIKEIDDRYEDEIDRLYETKLEKLIELSREIQNRENIYQEILESEYPRITLSQKRKISEALKERKTKDGLVRLEEIKINELSLDFKIPSKIIELWMNWIISCYEYIKIEKKCNEIEENIMIFRENHDYFTKNLVYKVGTYEKISLSK
jgi:hypothetical protein